MPDASEGTADPGGSGRDGWTGPRATARRGHGPRSRPASAPQAESVFDTVLVVEDDRAMATILAHSLQARGYQADVASSAEEALESTGATNPALVILDLGLPGMPGLDLCRRLRAVADIPILVVTADGAESQKVSVLDAGADDYITKPFSMPELQARIRAALRRSRRPPDQPAGPVIEVGGLVIDNGQRTVELEGQPIVLTPKEFDLLALMAANAGRIMTHAALLKEVWGPFSVGRREYLRTYANQLRKKLGTGPCTPRLITEPTVGYRLVAPGT